MNPLSIVFKVGFVEGDFGTHFKTVVKISISVITLTVSTVGKVDVMRQGKTPASISNVGGDVVSLTIITIKSYRPRQNADLI